MSSMEAIATQSVKRRLWKIINNTGLDYVLRDNGHKGINAKIFELSPVWSGRRVSNPRPSAWEADALPLSYSRQNRIYFSPKISICKEGVLVSSKMVWLCQKTRGFFHKS